MKMKLKNFYVSYLAIALLLFSHGCINQPEQLAMSSDGVEISFDKKGKGIPALIFIHGWTNNRSIWDAQMAHFSKKYSVVAVDLAGCGKSGNNRKSWTMSSFGDDVTSVINALNLDQVILVGFSMGGPVAVETANKVPNRIAGIVLVDTMEDIEAIYSPETITYIDSVFMDLVTNPTPEKLEGVFYKKNPDASFARILDMLSDVSQIGWKESLHENFRWVNEDCIKSLKKIRAPVIAINSDAQPTNSEAFRAVVPSFEAKIIKDVGHIIFWDNPEEFNALLEESIQVFMRTPI